VYRRDSPFHQEGEEIHRELSKRSRHGRNWTKTRDRLGKDHDHLAHQRKDIRNKVVSRLVSTYDSIAIQEDIIRGWQKVWGKRVATTAMGGIMNGLRKKSHTLVVVGRFEPTTKRWSGCGTLSEIRLDERIYHCGSCGLHIDRDLNAAMNDWKKIPAERRESTPVDMKAATELVAYFNGIPHISASLVEEAGSRLLATGATSFDPR